jgi:two-component system, NarL family, nitrate/nitrite response regulator NarL
MMAHVSGYPPGGYLLAAMLPAAPVGRLAGMRLMCVIVDDNKLFLDVARAVLERQGMAVVGVAATSAEAVVLARELRPDVALVDISLGDESGFDVARLIADYVGDVILISSNAEDDYADLIADSPATGFITKTELSATAIRRLIES